MTETLYDIMSKVNGTKVTIHGVELTIGKFSLGAIFSLKEKYGLTADNFMQELSTSPIEYAPAIIWELLVEKEQFGSYEKFLSCLDIQHIEVLSKAVQDAFTDGQPVVKNEVGS
jgi:hypothetical protein